MSLSLADTQANNVFYSQLNKGKLHGCIDVGLSVMSIKKKAMCIDLDTEDNIYHLKVTLEAHSLFVDSHSSFSQVPALNSTLWHPGEVSGAV